MKDTRCFARSCATIVIVLGSLNHGLTAQAAPTGIPALSGPHRVGTRRLEWTDSSRQEVAALMSRDATGGVTTMSPSGPRRVVVHFWYPAAATAAPAAPYNPSAAAFHGLIRDTTRLRAYASLSGRAGVGTKPLEGRYPLVVFSPGSSMFVEDYTFLLEDLVSHGYVVAAVAHPGTSLLAFRDGTLGTETAWRPPPSLSMSLEVDSLRRSWEFFRARDEYLGRDLDLVIRRVADPRWSPVAAIVDTSRIGLIGHSTGGSVVTSASRSLGATAGRALIVYDVVLSTLLFDQPIRTPLQLFRTTSPNYPPGWAARMTEALEGARAGAVDVLMEGGTHQGFSDRGLVAPADSVRRAQAAAQFVATRTWTLAFLDQHLKGIRSADFQDTALQARLGSRIVVRRP